MSKPVGQGVSRLPCVVLFTESLQLSQNLFLVLTLIESHTIWREFTQAAQTPGDGQCQ